MTRSGRGPAAGLAALGLALVACKAPRSSDPTGRAGPGDASPAPAPRDAAGDAIAAAGDAIAAAVPGDAAADSASGIWPELASYPLANPLRVIALPARTDVQRLD